VNARIARTSLLVLLASLLLAAGPAFANATITIVNLDGPNEGFNDPTPAAPVGGNTGTTVGQQRLNAFQYAADIWGSTLDSSVEIRIQARFDPLTCTSTTATLGSAGAIQIFANFPNAPLADTWYSVALANKLAQVDLAPPSDPSPDDISARFNSNLNGNPACLGGTGWYYGFDNNHGPNIDLVTVLLHEFGHGLGFQQFASLTSGNMPLGFPDTYNRQLLDTTTGKTWDQMTPAERVASAINTRHVVWTGATVNGAATLVLTAGTPLLRVNSPAGIAGVYAVGTAAFGPQLSSPGITGAVVLGLDPDEDGGLAAFTGTDGCSPLTNAAAVAGNIALVNRGGCTFVVKAKNAQDAGALAVVIANNTAGSPPPGLGGTDPTIIIPAVSITQADGTTIKGALPGVNATLGVDVTVLAGADTSGRLLMNTPNPLQTGSSISHWDPIAFRNQLMEPAINADLTHSVAPPEDLTLPLMRDIGWFADADVDGVPDDTDCEPHSDLLPTVVIGGCDSGVPNTFFATGPNAGCTISDLIHKAAAGATNHGGFVSAVAHLTNDLKKAGLISGAQKGAIQSCAAGASIP